MMRKICIITLLLIITGFFTLVNAEDGQSLSVPLTREIIKTKLDASGFDISSFYKTKFIDFTVDDLNGVAKKVKFSEYEGKVIILNFWATWCGPCVKEIPSLQKLYDIFKDSGVALITVASDFTAKQTALMNKTNGTKDQTIVEFIKSNRITFPVNLIGFQIKDGGAVEKYRSPYKVEYIPTTFIFNKQGFLVASVVGSKNWNSESIKEIIQFLIDEPAE